MIPSMDCKDVNERVCRDEKQTQCTQVVDQVSRQVNEEVCSTTHYEEICNQVPRQETKMVPTEKCVWKSVPSCRDI